MSVVAIDSLHPSIERELGDDAILEHYESGSNSHWLRVNFVSSIDGAVTLDGKSRGLGGEADHRVFHLLRQLCDVVLVGAGTVRTEGYGAMILDDSAVDARAARGLKPQPVFAIVSGSLELDAASAIFAKAPVRPIIITTRSADATRRDDLQRVAEVIDCGGESVDPDAMVEALAGRGLTRIHCEGGPSLFGSLLEADAVDEVCLTVSPLLSAGDSARIANGALDAPRGMSLAGILRSGDTLLLRYVRDR